MYLLFIYYVEVIGIALGKNDQTSGLASKMKCVSLRLLTLYLIFIMACSKTLIHKFN